VGAGLWHDTDFYTAFEEEFGAVFVWSMYPAFGPDGYIRYGLALLSLIGLVLLKHHSEKGQEEQAAAA
jgi:hypothetical protein